MIGRALTRRATGGLTCAPLPAAAVALPALAGASARAGEAAPADGRFEAAQA